MESSLRERPQGAGRPEEELRGALGEAMPGAALAGGGAKRWRKVIGEQGFPDPLLELIAARFRLLGEPLRLKLLAALTEGERNVGELVALTGAGQANVSKHLAVLMQGGLVKRRKVGTSIYYALADESVLTLCDIVCAGLQERFGELARSLRLPVSEERSSVTRSEADAVSL